jgi:hypothetical protein
VTRSPDMNQDFLLLEKCTMRGEYEIQALEILLVYLSLFYKDTKIFKVKKRDI